MGISLRSLLAIVVVFLNLNIEAQIALYPENSSIDTITGNSKIETGLSFTKDDDKTLFSTKIDFAGSRFTNELSIMDILQGKISGLDIISASGDPGRNAQAILRGQNIFGINSPLIVINGIPQKSHDKLFNLNNFYSEDIRSMIPVSVEDIKSVEVLKDGSSTALYGAEGADGVILIETKKGSLQKMRLTYQFNQSIIEEPSFLPMLSGDEYISYQLEARHNANPFLDIPRELAYDRDFADYYNYSTNTDWLKAVTQTGQASNHYLNVFGGNEKSRYFGSMNYLDQTGTIINTGYNRLLSRLNFEHSFTEKLSLAVNLNYANNKYNGNVIPEDENGSGRNILEMAFIKAPNMSIWKYDAEENRTGDYFIPSQNYQGNGSNYFNPIAVSESGNSTSAFHELMTTAYLNYDFKNWLRFRESFSYNSSSAVSKAYLPSSAVSSDSFIRALSINNKSDLGFKQFRNQLQSFIKIPFKDEKKNILNGTFTWIMQNEEYSIVTDKSNNLLIYLPEKNRNAAVSSIYYKLQDRYILNVNTRIESVKTDHDKNTWDHHYGISTGWRFSGESFFKKLHFLDNGLIYAGGSFSDYQSTKDFVSPFSVSQPNYVTQTYNLGLELGLFHNRLHFTTDYYKKKNEVDYTYSLSPSSTFKFKNEGWELMIDYNLIKHKDLTINFNFNTSHNENTYTTFPDDYNMESGTSISNGEYLRRIEVGQPIGSFFGFRHKGIYASDADAVAHDAHGNVLMDGEGTPVPMSYKGTLIFRGGDAKYEDINHDGLIDLNDVVYLGNFYPKLTGGFGSTIRFENLSLSCNFHYRSGNKVINQVAMYSEGLFYKNNQSQNVLNRWRVQGQQGPDILPRAYSNHPANNLGSDRYVEDGSFIRMNYINLSYQFNSEFCHKIQIKDLFLSLSAQRAITFSNYNGLDPETETSNNSFSGNRDEMRVYPPKIFTISIRITV